MCLKPMCLKLICNKSRNNELTVVLKHCHCAIGPCRPPNQYDIDLSPSPNVLSFYGLFNFRNIRSWMERYAYTFGSTLMAQ